MTVIVAARTAKDGIVIAADTQTTCGWLKERNDESKLWVAGGQFALGAAGDVRTSQVIRHFTDWPKWHADEDTDIEAFLVKRLWPAVKKAATDHGVLRSKEGIESLGASFIVAWGDHFADVSANGAVVVPFDGRCAIGSGYAEALGYLGDNGPWTKSDVIEAARRAAITAHGVAGPFDVVTTRDLTVSAVPAE